MIAATAAAVVLLPPPSWEFWQYALLILEFSLFAAATEALGLILALAGHAARPRTATVLAAAPDDLAGIASGVNNGIARAAGLMAVAALPALAGLSGRGYSEPAMLTPAYRTALLICAGLIAAGGLAALLSLPRDGRLAVQRDDTAAVLVPRAREAEHPAPCTSPNVPPVHGH